MQHLLLAQNRNLPFSSKKGFYAILTAFLFTVTLVVIILLILQYGVFIKEVDANTQQDLSQYTLVHDAKEKILHCYGNPLNTNKLNDECELALITGYEIHRLELEDCSSFSYESSDGLTGDKATYYIPIKEGGAVCLGTLSIWI